MRHLIIYMFFLIIAGCATPSYRFQSNPSEAEIEVTYKNGTKKIIGKTPLQQNTNELNPTNESVQIEFRKQGYHTSSVFVPGSSFDKSIDMTVNLQLDTRLQEGKKGDQAMNDLASGIADIQRDIQRRQLDVAIQKINRLIISYPNISTLYSLLGNVYYLDKRLEPALVNYKKALELNPTSQELVKVIEKIEGIRPGGKQ